MELRPLLISNNHRRNSANLLDAIALGRRTSVDVLYLDPPYNERDYGSYYHLTESIARWHKPRPTGKSGVPSNGSSKSMFCSRKTANEAMDNLLKTISAKLILVHYAVDGLIGHSALMKSLKALGPTSYRTWYIDQYGTTKGAKGKSGHRLYICKPR